jgi:hypothetical protein
MLTLRRRRRRLFPLFSHSFPALFPIGNSRRTRNSYAACFDLCRATATESPCHWPIAASVARRAVRASMRNPFRAKWRIACHTERSAARSRAGLCSKIDVAFGMELAWPRGAADRHPARCWGSRRQSSTTVWRDSRCNGQHLVFPTCVSASKSRCTSQHGKPIRAALCGPAAEFAVPPRNLPTERHCEPQGFSSRRSFPHLRTASLI